ncbi:WxcM-like domain-containing protein [Modestobacter sp. I12A-02628]|uniref:WxcM-like domain-containing protein n=1 Tax=Goekera deserti TaxID=2497753 RepID=A0A7K3WCK1_9ACTN|nr:FdtA/QdtA family cupin domain-containing protein [Goekera deserti]MPQ98614.1 WxcM-like domain-containing protein [Goekera deserti]NDI49014.1 WxcM-like domain-containing protein [Goekera deserti]NEL54195.1 WxcM-like domain-containing protein [Goekera deserti]
MTLADARLATSPDGPVDQAVERRARPWGRRSADKNWPEGGEALGCRIVELPRVHDTRGNLTFIEGGSHVPFDIGRVYYLYDVPGGEHRGGHAHRQLEQLIIAANGSFDVVVDDGQTTERFFLNRSYYGLYMPRMTWRELDNFSSGSVCLVLASNRYDESDYYRDYDEFVAARRAETVEESL